MEKIRFMITNARPNATYGKWGYDDVRKIKKEVMWFDLYDFILDIEKDFPDFIERWEDIISDGISEYIDDTIPQKKVSYNTPPVYYLFDCDLYDGDKLLTKYYQLSTFTGEKNIKDVLAGEYQIWLREKRLQDLGL